MCVIAACHCAVCVGVGEHVSSIKSEQIDSSPFSSNQNYGVCEAQQIQKPTKLFLIASPCARATTRPCHDGIKYSISPRYFPICNVLRSKCNGWQSFTFLLSPPPPPGYQRASAGKCVSDYYFGFSFLCAARVIAALDGIARYHTVYRIDITNWTNACNLFDNR